ncbi:binding-protein-dependent transport system inner membrane protein [Nitratireductor aquibiodomus RA22]|uniref:Binding-protein-dependent transport system inner membrane protein n=1 Tax=Nitratireductor aquibiodomus RA22 TaxID=1189611 RepID=I5C0W9_9HYPH|nr:ABC transporter permease [Nitratireductor aquibiodomus]EIM75471.1 binding-protein-dependent transport system inner membrane protein [Nitratireductor aquibiodomus RA22]
MRFVLRRLAFYLVAFLVAATFNFLIPRLMPGNPADVMLAQAQGTLPPEAREALMETFGFINEPLYLQYLKYLGSIFTWDFGLSVKYYPTPVYDLLARALPWTLFLTGTATLVAYALGTLLGIRAAWRRGSRFDSVVSPLALALQSIPPVVVAITALFVFAITLNWLPAGYAFDPSLEPSLSGSFLSSVFFHALMPVLSLSIVLVGGYLITMRNNMIGQLGEDYVHLAEAKGLSDARVRYNYAARNAFLPSITALAISLGSVFGGSLITEVVFNYPGLGNLLYMGVIARDFPLIQGQLLIMTLAMLSANFAVDIACVALDPRLRRA